ncbi:MAG: MFS transporter [Anaerolineales bacterium]|nr:MFS transporter [Anaerolineales bacterium]
MQIKKQDLLPWYTKLFYGAADFGFAFVDSCVAVLFAIFMTDIVGLPTRMAALAIFVGKSWDYINDPIIGYLCDRTRTRWGRRRPFLLFGFIPFGLSFLMLWWIPPLENQWLLTAYYALAFFFFDTMVTVVTMPYFALTPELTQDYDERTSLTSYRMAFSLIGGLTAFVVPLAIIGETVPENADRALLMGALFAIAASLPILLTFFGTREKPEYIAQTPPTLRESLQAARKNRPFLFAMGVFLFTWTAMSIIENQLFYFLEYRMGMEEEAPIVAGTVFITAIIVLPLWVWAAHKTDKRKAYILGMLFLSAVMVTLIFIPPTLGLGIVLTLAALAGVGVSAVHVLTWAMIPDAVEVDELESGARHEGMFYALVTLFRKIAVSIALPLVLLLLDASGFLPNSAEQPESAVNAIRFLMGPMPSLFLLGGIVFALFYPLSREVHHETRQKISLRRKPESA